MPTLSLRTKIFWLLSGITLVTGVLLIALVSPILKNEMRLELSEKGEFMAHQVALTSVNALLSKELLQLQIMLKEYPHDDDDTVYIYIENKHHETIAHTFEGGFPSDLENIHREEEEEMTLLLLDDLVVVDISKPILEGSLGYVHVGLSDTVISQRAQKIIRVIFLIILGVLASAILLAAYFSRKLTGPLTDLVGVSHAIGEGDFSKRTTITGNDELGTLGRSFNEMIDSLQKTTVSKVAYQSQIEFLNVVLASIPYPFYVIDVANYSVVLANPATGSPEIWEQSTCHALTHHRDTPCGQGPEGCICPLDEVMKTGKPVTVEHLHYDEDGKKRYYEVHGYPIFDKNNTIVKMIEFSIDITERTISQKNLVESRAELEKAYKDLKSTHSQMIQQEKMASIGQLAAGVAHEINNPIGFISSNLNTMTKYSAKISDFINTIIKSKEIIADEESRERVAEKLKKSKIDFILEDTKDLVEESLEGTKRVAEIVTNLKGFARLDEQSKQPAHINDCIESSLKIIWNELKYNANIVKEYGDLPQTTCFPGELNQVFMNILINAAHSLEGQGEITIRTWHENDTIYTSISDTGCGIPEESISKIFEPFFTTKEVGKGTGLGMSICYDIVKKHGGEISVRSKLGEGTTFTIEIPVVA